MVEETLQQKVGIDREGVKRGSPFIPFVISLLVLLLFVSSARISSLPKVQLFNDVQGLPSHGENLLAIRQDANGGELSFLIFDKLGKPRSNAITELQLREARQGEEEHADFDRELLNLKNGLAQHVLDDQIPAAVQDRIACDALLVINDNWRSGEITACIASDIRSMLTHDFPLIFRAQISTIGLLLLFSLLPGILGMIYRRAFMTWFLGAFALLYSINWFFHSTGTSAIYASARAKVHLPMSEPTLLVVETITLVLLLFFRLSRHTAEVADTHSKRNNIIMAVVMLLLALAWVILALSCDNDAGSCPIKVTWWQVGLVSVLVMVGYRTLVQSLKATSDLGARSKNIVVCLDGTWNQPGTKDFGYLAETNVFKLFMMLRGEPSDKQYNANRRKEYLDNNNAVKQVALYYHGVGNSVENSVLGQLFGGAFGMGASAIVERAYLDVVKVYRPGDRIYIFGFSRGAAISRLLAGMISRRGVPTSLWTLRLFGQHFTVYRSRKKLQHAMTDYRKRKAIESDEVLIDVLGCWDTVGSFGISKDILGIPFQKINLLKDLTVPLCVKRAYHMVAMDETRDSFEPTLMDLDPTTPNRIIEVWFSGNHSNIGGGYATDKLSNVTLDFLLQHISSSYAYSESAPNEDWGLFLSARRQSENDIAQADPQQTDEEQEVAIINPDPLGQLRSSTGPAYSYAPRTLPVHSIVHDSVFERMKEALPVYAPPSLFILNQELYAKRADIDTEVERLSATHSLEPHECETIRDWSHEKLSLMRWSSFTELELDDGTRLIDHIKPSVELKNEVK